MGDPVHLFFGIRNEELGIAVFAVLTDEKSYF